MVNSFPAANSGGHVANAIRPPGLVTRTSSDAQISGLGAKMCPKLNLLEYSNCLLAVVKITEKVIHSLLIYLLAYLFAFYNTMILF